MNRYKRQKQEDLEMSNLNIFSSKKKKEKLVKLKNDDNVVHQNKQEHNKGFKNLYFNRKSKEVEEINR